MTEAQPDTQTLLQTAQAQAFFSSHMKHYAKPITSEVTIEPVISEAELQKQKLLASLAFLQPQPPGPHPNILSGFQHLSLSSSMPNPLPSVLASALQAAAPQIALQSSLVPPMPATSPVCIPSYLPDTTNNYSAIQIIPPSIPITEFRCSESCDTSVDVGSESFDFEDCVPQDLSMKKKPETETKATILREKSPVPFEVDVQPKSSPPKQEDQNISDKHELDFPTEPLLESSKIRGRGRGRPRKLLLEIKKFDEETCEESSSSRTKSSENLYSKKRGRPAQAKNSISSNNHLMLEKSDLVRRFGRTRKVNNFIAAIKHSDIMSNKIDDNVSSFKNLTGEEEYEFKDDEDDLERIEPLKNRSLFKRS